MFCRFSFAVVVIVAIADNSSLDAVPVNNNKNHKNQFRIDDKPITPTLLVSVDGFRADKLDAMLANNPDSYLRKYFKDEGVKASHMTPSFPSSTFPNHWTLVTGMYMESHGITGNKLYDSSTNESINFLRDKESNDEKWWNKTEPIWLSAKDQGMKAASFFWPGSEVWPRNPDQFVKYTNNYPFKARVDMVVNWFEKLDLDFGTLYFDEPDKTGHRYGPDSEEYTAKILEVDATIGYLIEELDKRNLLDGMNIVIASDHGMGTMEGTVYVKDLFDRDLVDHKKTIYGICAHLHPIDSDDTQMIYESMLDHPHITPYLREEIPDRFHYSNTSRVGPIVVIANEGYTFHWVKQTLKGNHGFDNQLKTMRTIFMARGPDFKKNVQIEAGRLKNVDVYSLLCALMQITCKQNNGTTDPFLDVVEDSVRDYMTTQLEFL
jgi:ectonucleotide pyrophosphatase/phosphodiesterase family protein 5